MGYWVAWVGLGWVGLGWVGWLIGWSFGWPVGQLVGWSVGLVGVRSLRVSEVRLDAACLGWVGLVGRFLDGSVALCVCVRVFRAPCFRSPFCGGLVCVQDRVFSLGEVT